MRKYDGKTKCYRDMTTEEIETHKADFIKEETPKTAEERIAELEEAIALLLEGAVE